MFCGRVLLGLPQKKNKETKSDQMGRCTPPRRVSVVRISLLGVPGMERGYLGASRCGFHLLFSLEGWQLRAKNNPKQAKSIRYFLGLISTTVICEVL